MVIPASNGHILDLLVDGLRTQDVDELAAIELEPEQALIQSYNASMPHCFTILASGYPCAMFGATAPGIPWMLGTDRMLEIPRDLMVQGRYWIDYLNLLYPFLQNHVAVNNTVSFLWLSRMGFTFHEELLVNRTLFRRFTRGPSPE
ncbi:MAG: hypothetical protein V3S01_07000 [Dehalococcoidia bacterium]